MASLRHLFFAVYASNGLIRVLFLPLCYLLLLSPFLALVGYYFGVGKRLRNDYLDGLSWIDLLPQITLSAVFLLLPTRLISGFKDAAKSKDGGKRRVQSLPYWIPGLQNFFSIVSGGEKWAKSVRYAFFASHSTKIYLSPFSTSSLTSIIAYTVAGTKHNAVVSDALTSKSLLAQLLEQKECLQEPQSVRWAMLHNAFKASEDVTAVASQLGSDIETTIHHEIFADTAIRNLLAATLTSLSDSLPDLITFNSSIVDQMQWERVADVELTDGTSEAECNFFALVNEFSCNAVLPQILGAQFTESYQLLATDLAAFNQRYWALALGLPRWSPLPGLPGAALAQQRLLQNLTRVLGDLTYPPVRRLPDDDESVSGDETDADTITPIMKINELFTKHDLPMPMRASITLQVVHKIVAEVVPLVFWSLLRVCSNTPSDTDTKTLENIRVQSRPWAQAIQPPSIHPSFPAPPAISYSSYDQAMSGGQLALPLSCINETRRLYSVSTWTYLINKPISIQEDSLRPGEKDTWELASGTYIDIGLSRNILNASPQAFPDPQIFKPERFMDQQLDLISITPKTDAHAPYITAIVTCIVVGIIQLWEISPAPKKTFLEHMQEAREEAKIGAAALTGDQKTAKSSEVALREASDKKATWVLPQAIDGASVKVPKGDIRVRIRRREGLPEKKMEVRR